MSVIVAFVVGVVAVALARALFQSLTSRNRGPLPPGPKRLPIIGNLLDVPREKEWLTYRSWTEKYGGVVYMEILGTKVVILGHEETIRDLVDKRVTWQDRPRSVMLNELIDFDPILSAMPYGAKWRQGRKMLHPYLYSGAVAAYEPIQLTSARRLVAELHHVRHGKEVLLPIVRENFGASIIRMTYGIDVKGADNKYVTIPEKVLHAISEAATPGNFLVDAIPLLKYIPAWFPGAHFKRSALATNRYLAQMMNGPFERTKENMAAGTAPVSIAQRMLENVDENDGEVQAMIRDLAGVVYLAGADTTVAAVISFFLAAVMYPEMQKRAQAELDAVVGRNRLPEFQDQDRLPYVKAVMSECLRWLPLVPFGVPHATAQDDTYRGYFIPKGTVVLSSQWALLHDPTNYPEPEQFVPERYLNQSPSGTWTYRSDVRDPRDFCFGWGRRICPGAHVAEQSLFATITTVLHTLNVERAKDAYGVEFVPEAAVSAGLTSHPKAFDYDITMRKDAEELVQLCGTC